MSLQAAGQLGRTQIVKVLTQEAPELLLDQDSVKVAQLIVLEVFATNAVRRPLFTLGIVSSLARDIGIWGAPPFTPPRSLLLLC